MKRLCSLFIVVALVALTVTGCWSGTPSTPGTVTPVATSTPATGPSVTPTSTTPTEEQVPINVYFSYQEKMQAVQRYAPAGTKAVLRAALDALLQGPTEEEKTAGLTSQIPAGTTLLGLTISDGVAYVDLNSHYDDGGGSLSMFHRIAQVVYTSTQFKTVKSVQFSMNGKRVKALGGEGVIIEKPQTRKMWEEQAPAILVESPAWGGVVTEGSTIKGTANVFEGVFQLQLKDSSGVKLMDVTINATSGTGTRGTWTTTAKLGVTTATAGTLRVFDYSPKDGKPENVVEIPVVFER